MNITRTNIRTWSMLGQRGTFFGVAMPQIAQADSEIKLLTADVGLLSGMDRYAKQFPEQFLNVGIAEQNMIGIAAGLAMEGKCVFASTYASFVAVRSLEHIRQHLSHMRCNVKVIGTAAGVAAAKSGVSHCATEDIAFLRALPNLWIFSPADSLEAYKIALFCAKIKEPVYVRISGGLNCPIVYQEDYDFIPGKGVKLKEGKDVAIIATGLMVSEAMKAAKHLQEAGISCGVYNFHTIKPLDTELLRMIFSHYGFLVTMEEHNVIGGLGSAVAEFKATQRDTPPQLFLGFRDHFQKAGSQSYLWEKAGLTGEKAAEMIQKQWEN